MEFIKLEYLIAAVAIVVWLVRLEGKINIGTTLASNAQKAVDDLRIKHESLDAKIIEQLAQVRESLARLEGALGIKHVKGEK